MKKYILITLFCLTAFAIAGLDNPISLDTVLKLVGGTMEGDIDMDSNDINNVNYITVDRIYFTNGGTNSWITMDSTTNVTMRINGSNTVFNVDLGQE